MPVSIQLMFANNTHQLSLDQASALLKKLHESQKARYESITNPERRNTWLLGRALLVAAMEYRYGCCDPASIRTDPHGGILLDDVAAQVSLSHSHHKIVISLSETRVGVDIEYKKKRGLLRHASKIFAPAESRHLHARLDAEQLDVFYIYWTLKEAACKASDMPLLACLQNACFDLQNYTFRLHHPFTAQDWCFMSAPVELKWRMALAIPGTRVAPRIECWQLSSDRQWRRFHLDQHMFLPATETHHAC